MAQFLFFFLSLMQLFIELDVSVSYLTDIGLSLDEEFLQHIYVSGFAA
jgi:hypothetical protein